MTSADGGGIGDAGQSAPNDAIDRRDGGRAAERRWLIVDNGVQHLGDRASAERRPAGERLEQDGGGREQIATRTQAVLRQQLAQRARSAASQSRDAALEVREVAPRDGDRLGLVVDEHVDHAVARLHVARADLLGLKTPSPPPSTIAGPPMPMLLPAVAMITSQQPSSAALPAKQRPATMPTTRHLARSAARSWRRS